MIKPVYKEMNYENVTDHFFPLDAEEVVDYENVIESEVVEPTGQWDVIITIWGVT